MEKSLQDLKIALVTDWMLSPGGSDRVLISLLGLFRNATVFTAIYNQSNYSDEFKINAQVKTTFLQKLPLSFKLHRHYNLLAPLAFESLDLKGYDLVISLSAGASKGVITSLNQKHLAIVFTPPRTLWDGTDNYRGSGLSKFYRLITPFIAHWLRMWDFTAIKRTDKVLSISKFIQRKVKKYYRIESDLLYPGISSWWFTTPLADGATVQNRVPQDYYLVVSRLYDYKRIDLAIRAALKADVNLAIVGSGPDLQYLKQLVGDSERIIFLGNVSDNQLKYLYSNAKAFLFCGIEDFGLVPVEAMACGCPVFAFNQGGVAEIVDPGKSGELFATEDELHNLLTTEAYTRYDKKSIVNRAKAFSEEKFHREIISQIEKLYER